MLRPSVKGSLTLILRDKRLSQLNAEVPDLSMIRLLKCTVYGIIYRTGWRYLIMCPRYKNSRRTVKHRSVSVA